MPKHRLRKVVRVTNPVTCALAMVGLMIACKCGTATPSVSIGQLTPGPVARDGETVYALCDVVLPQSTPLRRVWRTSTSEGGVTAMLRDGGWLWAATPFDVVRLNLNTLECTRFILGHTGDDDKLPTHVSGLLLDPEGQMWAAGYGILVRYDGQTWQSVHLDERVAGGLAFDAEGNLWVDVAYYRSVRPRRYPGHEPPGDGVWEGEPAQEPLLSSELDCGGWFASSSFYQLDFRSPEECRLLSDWYARLDSLAPPEGIAPWESRPPIAAESSERLWMLAHSSLDNDPKLDEAPTYDALLSFDGRSWQVLSWPYGSTALLVADEARGGVWVGTDEGLVFSDGQSIQRYLLSPGDATPVGPTVNELAADANGRLWATTYEGLLFYDEAADSWQRSEIREQVLISADDRGGLWAISYFGRGGTVSFFDGEAWTHQPLPADWPCFHYQVLADAGGGVWLSSTDCALRGFNGEVWDEYSTGGRRERLARGPSGEVYAVAGGDLKRLDGTTWETLLPASSYGWSLEQYGWAEDLVVGTQGEVWIAFAANLLVYRESGWEEVPAPTEGRITALLISSQGDVWVGHAHGLLRYDGQSWESIGPETRPATVHSLAEDGEGRIWVAQSDGLYVYDKTRE